MHDIKEARYSLDGGPEGGGARAMRLDYYLRESEYMPEPAGTDTNIVSGTPVFTGSLAPARVFGIEVVKTESGKTERAYIGEVTADMAKAYEIFKLLSSNLVTPCSLREVLEDICAGI